MPWLLWSHPQYSKLLDVHLREHDQNGDSPLSLTKQDRPHTIDFYRPILAARRHRACFLYDVRHTITRYKSIIIPDLHYWDTVFKLQEILTSLKELSIETTFIGEKLSPSLWRCSFPSLEVLKLKTLLPKIQSLHLNIWHYRFNGDFPGIIQELNGLNYPVRYLKVRTDSLYILSNLFPTTKLLDLDVEESVTYIPSD